MDFVSTQTVNPSPSISVGFYYWYTDVTTVINNPLREGRPGEKGVKILYPVPQYFLRNPWECENFYRL